MALLRAFLTAVVALQWVASSSTFAMHRELPAKVLVGYASTCEDGAVRRAVSQGVNVVIWAFAAFAPDRNKKDSRIGQKSSLGRVTNSPPSIHTDLDIECIRREIQALDEGGFGDTVHLVGFGGWNGEHLNPSFSSQELYKSFQEFGGDVFHGIDWDFEGCDDLGGQTNHFSVTLLDRMGEVSELAKRGESSILNTVNYAPNISSLTHPLVCPLTHADGYIVSMAPPQSYLDPSSTGFSRHVNLTGLDEAWHPNFAHRGRNVYAYLLAKYGDSIDFVSVQLYESFSRAAYDVMHLGVRPRTYIESYVSDLALRRGMFWVDFEEDPELNVDSQLVSLPINKLVIGLANGWADNSKTLFIDPTDVEAAYHKLKESNFAPRGFMYWTIDEEGNSGVHMSEGLNRALQIRVPFNEEGSNIKAIH